MNNTLFFKNIITEEGEILECLLLTPDILKNTMNPPTLLRQHKNYTFLPKCSLIDEVSSQFISDFIPVCSLDLPPLPVRTTADNIGERGPFLPVRTN